MKAVFYILIMIYTSNIHLIKIIQIKATYINLNTCAISKYLGNIIQTSKLCSKLISVWIERGKCVKLHKHHHFRTGGSGSD